ncbi:MAG: hypothetical protein EOP53_04270 [Sphingobacteriales bacterium]|nr:MAG: hypothetical protein EOP53_04270 [Sphingobacteriales bacterium]
MNKILTGIVIAATAILTSCGGSDSPETDKSIMPPADSNKAIVAPAQGIAPQTTISTPTQALPNPQPMSGTQPATTAAAAAGLNPAHGQPGHRCDIAVGAPLNSAPAAAATAPQPVQTVSAPTPTITAPAPSTAPADPNAKLNPPHGQPGHDCAIAVGAPLKKG